MTNENWVELRNITASQLVIDELTPSVLVFGLTTEIGGLFEVINKEMITKTPHPDEKLDSLSELFWTVAALEVCFNIPPSLYSDYVNSPLTINPDHGFELLGLHADLMKYTKSLSESVFDNDIDETQFSINKLLVSIYNVLIYFNISPTSVLQECVKKLTEGDSKDYQKDFEEDTNRFDTKKEMIVLDIKVDRRRKKPLKGVYMKAYGEVFEYNSGDIIADFFSATNTLYTKFKGKQHAINYSPRFREYLDTDNPQVESGFIIGEEVVSIRDLLQKEEVVDGVITIDNKAIPVLIKPGIETLNNLLDYVLEARKDK